MIAGISRKLPRKRRMANGIAGSIPQAGIPDSSGWRCCRTPIRKRANSGVRRGIRVTGRRSSALPQLAGGDESNADHFAPAPDQVAYPTHFAARREGKAEHFGNSEVAHV